MITPAFVNNEFYHRRVGDYLLVDEFPPGNMGRVFVAEKVATPAERVAIKMLRPDSMGSSDAVKRFQREIRIMRQAQNPYIVRFIDELDQAGYLFIVMELIPGPTIRQVLRERTFTQREAVAVWVLLANALGYLHSRNILHRDVASDNVKVREDYGVKLMDFGIATMEGEEVVTQLGARVGKIVYMPPEQVRGEHLTIQVDIHAFGILAYEMLTGGFPFNREEQESRARGERALRRIRWSAYDRTRFAPAIIAFVDRCTAYLPGARFSSCEALVACVQAMPRAVLEQYDARKQDVDRAEARALRDQGKAALNRGQYQRAARLFQQSLRHDDGDADVPKLMLEAMAMSASYCHAVESMSTEIAASTTEQELAESRRFSREIREQARICPARAVQEAARVLIDRARTTLAQGDMVKAYELFHAALAVEPGMADAQAGADGIRTTVTDIDDQVITRKRLIRARITEARACLHERQYRRVLEIIAAARSMDAANDEFVELEELARRLLRRRHIRQISVATTVVAAAACLALVVYLGAKGGDVVKQRQFRDTYLTPLAVQIKNGQLGEAAQSFSELATFVRERGTALDAANAVILAALRQDFSNLVTQASAAGARRLAPLRSNVAWGADAPAALRDDYARVTNMLAKAVIMLASGNVDQLDKHLNECDNDVGDYLQKFAAQQRQCSQQCVRIVQKIARLRAESGDQAYSNSLRGLSTEANELMVAVVAGKLGTTKDKITGLDMKLGGVESDDSIKRTAKNTRDMLSASLSGAEQLRNWRVASEQYNDAEMSFQKGKLAYSASQFTNAQVAFDTGEDRLADARARHESFTNTCALAANDVGAGLAWLIAVDQCEDMAGEPAYRTASNTLAQLAALLQGARVKELASAEELLGKLRTAASQCANVLAAVPESYVGIESIRTQISACMDTLRRERFPFAVCAPRVSNALANCKAQQRQLQPKCATLRTQCAALQRTGIARFTPMTGQFANASATLARADVYYRNEYYRAAARAYDNALRQYNSISAAYARSANVVPVVSNDVDPPAPMPTPGTDPVKDWLNQ